MLACPQLSRVRKYSQTQLIAMNVLFLFERVSLATLAPHSFESFCFDHAVFSQQTQRELVSASDRSMRSARSEEAGRDSLQTVRPVARLCFQRPRYVREDVRQWKDLPVQLRSARSWAQQRSSSACRSERKTPGPADCAARHF